MSHILHDESDSQIRKKKPKLHLYMRESELCARIFIAPDTLSSMEGGEMSVAATTPTTVVTLIISAHMQKKGGGTFFIVITPSPYGIAFQTKKGFEFSLVRTGKGCVCVCIRFLHKRGVDFSRHIAQLVSNAHF